MTGKLKILARHGQYLIIEESKKIYLLSAASEKVIALNNFPEC